MAEPLLRERLHDSKATLGINWTSTLGGGCRLAGWLVCCWLVGRLVVDVVIGC